MVKTVWTVLIGIRWNEIERVLQSIADDKKTVFAINTYSTWDGVTTSVFHSVFAYENLPVQKGDPDGPTGSVTPEKA